MPVKNRLLSSLVCAVLLILLSMAAGCTSYQPATPATAAPPSAAGTPAAPAQPAAPTGSTVTIKDFAFTPASLTIAPGTTVTWVNQDSAPHRILSGDGAPEAFSSAALSNGGSYSFTFTKPGTYPYICSIHPSMKGTVVVQG